MYLRIEKKNILNCIEAAIFSVYIHMSYFRHSFKLLFLCIVSLYYQGIIPEHWLTVLLEVEIKNPQTSTLVNVM